MPELVQSILEARSPHPEDEVWLSTRHGSVTHGRIA